MVNNKLIAAANEHLKQNDVREALACFEEGRSFAVKSGKDYEACLCILGMSSCHKELKQKAKALRDLSLCEEFALRIAIPERQLECFMSIADCYFRLSASKKAYEYLKKYAELEEKQFMDRMLSQINEIRTSYELEKHQFESMNIIDVASRLASIGVIIGGITHEINQPLSAINVNSDSVLYWDKKNPGYLPDIIVRATREISLSAKRIDDIITRMRHYWTTTEAGADQQHDLNTAVQKSLELLNGQLLTHSIELVTDLNPEEMLVNGSQIYIEQIVINIIVHLLLQTEKCTTNAKQISVGTRKEKNVAQIDVEDNYSTYQDLPELSSNTYSALSWGKNFTLGLVIVKHAVERFGGTIECSQNGDCGTRFHITIPLSSKVKIIL